MKLNCYYNWYINGMTDSMTYNMYERFNNMNTELKKLNNIMYKKLSNIIITYKGLNGT